MCLGLSAHTITGLRIKSKLQELDMRRSAGSDEDTKPTNTSPSTPAPIAQWVSSTLASSSSARLQPELVQQHCAVLGRRPSEDISNTPFPTSGGFRTLCASCCLPSLWP